MEMSKRQRAVIAEAADWFVRMQCEPTRQERVEFVSWLRTSPGHAAEFIQIAQIHGAVGLFDRWSCHEAWPDGPADDTVVDFPGRLPGPRVATDSREPANQRKRAAFPWVLCGAAASVVAVCVVGLMQLRGRVIDTARGERQEVVLDDGSRLLVDPETRLRVKYSSDQRDVFLERGRAFFHVAKNRQRPFLVHADNTVARAVGTAFSVERGSREVIVTVTEGRVAVTTLQAGEKATMTTTGSAGGAVELTVDQQILLKEGVRDPVVQPVDGRQAVAWAEGKLIFKNDPLSAVVAQFNRYNQVQILVTDDALARQPVSGVFNAAEPQSFVEFLRSVAAVKVTRQGDDNITLAAGSH